tara:strand:- start:3729 stop:5021 length:1293 start_codon:yes stop_codon:yes gene_type:complete
MFEKFKKSQEYLKKAYTFIPSATQTFSKGPSQWPTGASPNFIEKGLGAWVWDVDGNKYLDHLMALGAVILGYGNEQVNREIKKYIDSGVIFSQMHPLEIELSEKLVHLIPSAEMVKLFKNGSDATTAAIRAARAFTGRDHIIFCGYHGWHDWYVATTSRSFGIPDFNKELSHQFQYNNIDSLRSLIQSFPNKISAVIMEPVGVEKPEEGFLEEVREICTKEGIILIFDEIVTGFRFHMGGYQSICGVIPDMSCFGKAMGNGMPISALVGRREIMKLFETHLFVSGTFGGEVASIAACCKTIDVLQDENGLAKIKFYSDRLCQGIRELIKAYRLESYMDVKGYSSRSILTFLPQRSLSVEEMKTYFMQECIKENLLYFCSHVPCVSHSENELTFSLKALDMAMSRFSQSIKSGDLLDKIESKVIEPIFRKA